MMDASPRTAIATIWDGDQRLGCGIPLWCQGARLLSRQIPRSQIVLLSQRPSEDCAEATVVWSEETATAAAAYVASHAMRVAEVQTALGWGGHPNWLVSAHRTTLDGDHNDKAD